jgi:hypothetical protein
VVSAKSTPSPVYHDPQRYDMANDLREAQARWNEWGTGEMLRVPESDTPSLDAAAREAAKGPPGAYDASEILVCTDPAQLPGVNELGGRHHWLKTPQSEAGQAAGEEGLLSTEIGDHRGRSEGRGAGGPVEAR